jgi:GNAT superfamily N-acetyltransferase
MSPFSVVPYEPRHRRAVFALMESVWGEWMDEEQFVWWFDANPAGRSSIALAETDGRVVGIAAVTYYRARVDGREALLPVPGQMATHPDARGQGVFETLARDNERRASDKGAPVEIGFPNDAAHPIWLKKVGWEDLPPVRLWARPLRPLAAALAMRGRPSSGPSGLRPPADEPRRYGRVEVRPLERVPPEADELGSRAAAGYGNHVLRGAAHMNWRFADAPSDYRLFGAYRDGRLAGLAVVGHKVHHGVSTGFVADLVAPPGAFAETRALLRRALAEVRGGADVLVSALPPPAAQRRAFVSVGFVPTPLTIRVGGKALPEGPIPAGARDWHFALGDTDFF